MGSEHSGTTYDNEAPIGLPKLSVYSTTPNSSEWTSTKSRTSTKSMTSYKTPSSTINEEKLPDIAIEVNNGVTGKYISSRIASIAALFWSESIESLSFQEQLVSHCHIYNIYILCIPPHLSTQSIFSHAFPCVLY